ncbi:DNA internalization-related competence protein ComEC/Rec2 [Acinetobacter sp. Marseille-Q1618]|uniref:DNA internalization-related competence protein ComEC/Rec2 n=1 Tax=Acinetobacter sp. Marseille-Q1618 TaxID=2697502 RepID=UPI001C2D2BFE|nr:DNA internalization-related competence protein ComEC/Rec2 [Acinetobacter sp. Marseille-Q1618]
MWYLYGLSLGWILGISCMGNPLPESLQMSLYLSLIFIVFISLATTLKWKLTKHVIIKTIFNLSLCLSIFMGGWHYADHALEQRLKLRLQHVEQVNALVYVNTISQISTDVDQQLRIKQNVWLLNSVTQPIKISVNLKQGQLPLALGKYYQISGKLKPAHSYAVAGAFDKERWFLQENIMGSLNAQFVQPIDATVVSRLGYTRFVQKNNAFGAVIRLSIEEKRLSFREMIQNSSLQQKGLLLALLTGDESLLSDDTQNLFQRLGISHLLAISGPHVLIFAMLFCFIFQRIIEKFRPEFYLKCPRPYLLIIPFWVCVALYTAFVGFEIPALRTLLTVSLCSMLIWFRQSLSALKMLLISASILLWIDPFSILSAAFWLSYGACFILIRVYQTLQQQPHDYQTNTQKIVFYLKVLIESQWKVFIALFPLVIFIFQKVAWVAPLSNLFAIPLIGAVVVPLEVIGACLSLFYVPLGKVFFYVADWVLSFLLHILVILDQLFAQHLQWFAFTPLMIVCLATAIFILFLPRGVISKAWVAVCSIPLIFPQQKQSDFSLTILDVAQGQAIFLNLPTQKMMIDTGGSFDETKFSLGRQLIVPYLKRQGIQQLDQVILSHLDQDHSGAFPAIAEQVKVKQVFSNENDGRFKQENFHYCYAGQVWQYDQVKIEILSPPENSLSNVASQQNELSCVVYIQVKNAKNQQNFLIMGDAGWEAEFDLLQHYPNLDVDVLVLGHHGSQHSSAYAFLETLKPKLAVISVGFDNRYGHPHPIVLARLKALNIPVVNTIEQGSIQFQLDAQHMMQMSNYRDSKKWLIR